MKKLIKKIIVGVLDVAAYPIFPWYNLVTKNPEDRPLLEYNDCTVMAFHRFVNIPYIEAHKFLAGYGRKPRKGFRLQCFMTNHKDMIEGIFGIKYEEVYSWMNHTGRGVSLKQFLDNNKVGKYIIRIKKHVFYMENGTVYDSKIYGKNTQVMSAFKIVENPQK